MGARCRRRLEVGHGERNHMSTPSRQEMPVKSFSISAYICQKDDNGGKFLLIKRASKTGLLT